MVDEWKMNVINRYRNGLCYQRQLIEGLSDEQAYRLITSVECIGRKAEGLLKW